MQQGNRSLSRKPISAQNSQEKKELAKKIHRTNSKNQFPSSNNFKKTQTFDKDETVSYDASSFKYTPIKKTSKNNNANLTLTTGHCSNSHQMFSDLAHETENFRKSRALQRDKKTQNNKDSSEYYKFWKQKANQYQSMNFNLQRVNSALEQQLEILKHQNQKLEKKLKTTGLNEIEQKFDDPLQRNKIEKFYETKLDALTKKLEEKDKIIKKQDLKIKELSKQMTDNYKLKSILQNMEDRVSDKNSLDFDERSFISAKKKSQGILYPPKLQNTGNHSSKNMKSSKTERQIKLQCLSPSIQYMVDPSLQNTISDDFSPEKDQRRLNRQSTSQQQFGFLTKSRKQKY